MRSNKEEIEAIMSSRQDNLDEVTFQLSQEVRYYMEKYNQTIEDIEHQGKIPHVLLLKLLNGEFNHKLIDYIAIAQSIGKKLVVSFEEDIDVPDENENYDIINILEDYEVETFTVNNDESLCFKRTGINVVDFLMLCKKPYLSLDEQDKGLIDQVSPDEQAEAFKYEKLLLGGF